MNTKISLFTCHLRVVILDSNFVNAYKLCVLLAEIMDPASREQYARHVLFSRCGLSFGLFLLFLGIGVMAMGYNEPSLRYFCHCLSCYIGLISRIVDQYTSVSQWSLHLYPWYTVYKLMFAINISHLVICPKVYLHKRKHIL